MQNEFVKIMVVGKNISLFFKQYVINKIEYKNLEQLSYNKIKLDIRYLDYVNLTKNKSIYKITLIENYGLLKLKNIFYNNKDFIISFVFSIIFLIFLSNICFDIKVIHNNK